MSVGREVVHREVFGFTLITLSSILIVGIHFVTSPAQRAVLTLNFARPEAYAFLTASYIHFSNSGAITNAIVFFTFSLYTLYLCSAFDRISLFNRTLPLLLGFVPILSNLGTYSLYKFYLGTTGFSVRGFSSVVAAIGGLTMITLISHFRYEYSRGLSDTTMLSVLYIIGGIIGLRYYDNLVFALLPILALLGTLSYYFYRGSGQSDLKTLQKNPRDTLLASFTIVFIVALTYILFPGELVDDTGFTNFFAHYLGLLFGVTIGIVAVIYQIFFYAIRYKVSKIVSMLYFRVNNIQRKLIVILPPSAFLLVFYLEDDWVAASTVLYATILFLVEFPGRPSMRIQSRRGGFADTGSGWVTSLLGTVQNEGIEPAIDPVVSARLVDPEADIRPISVQCKFDDDDEDIIMVDRLAQLDFHGSISTEDRNWPTGFTPSENSWLEIRATSDNQLAPDIDKVNFSELEEIEPSIPEYV